MVPIPKFAMSEVHQSRGMGQRGGRDNLDECHRVLALWPKYDDSALSMAVQKRFVRLRDATVLYLAGGSLEDVLKIAKVKERRFLRIFARCLKPDASGRILGCAGFVKGYVARPPKRSLVGAALYKLAVAYDLVQEMQTLFDADVLAMDQPARATKGRKGVRYGASCPEAPELDFRLLQLEMLGLFSKFLMSHRHLDPMYKVSWLELLHPMEFAPTWKAGKSFGNACYRIRARARVNETTVQRLVLRKWHDELSYVIHDASTPDGFWRHNQLDTVWSDRPATAETVFWFHLRPVDVPSRPVRPLSEMFTPGTKRS